MIYEIFIGFIGFVFVILIISGFNNLMFMVLGVNFGFMCMILYMFGIGIGFMVMVVLVGFGLMQVFDIVFYSYEVFIVVSILYFLWLVWKFVNVGELEI